MILGYFKMEKLQTSFFSLQKLHKGVTEASHAANLSFDAYA